MENFYEYLAEQFSQDRDWVELLVDWLIQVGIVALIFGLGVWLWPDGILDSPVSMISLGDWISVLSSAAATLFGAFLVYLVVIEPIVALLRGYRALKS